MNVLITGDRNWTDFDFLSEKLDIIHKARPIRLLKHGKARGADSCGGRWARARGIAVREYPAQWDLHGKAAGYVRNRQMLNEHEVVDLVIGFHDHFEESKGTADMIKVALQRDLPVLLFSHQVLMRWNIDLLNPALDGETYEALAGAEALQRRILFGFFQPDDDSSNGG